MKKVKFNKKPTTTLKLKTRKAYASCSWDRNSGMDSCSQTIHSCGSWSNDIV